MGSTCVDLEMAEFVNKTYSMVDDSATNALVSWSDQNISFIVWKRLEFERDLLPKYFKHNNFQSFVRQLNTYGFRKASPDRWEYANKGFLRDQRHLLKNISRRKPVSHHETQQQQQQTQGSLGPCVEVEKFGLECEVEKLKKDKNESMLNLLRLKQQQQEFKQALQLSEKKLEQTEQDLAIVFQNPSLFAHLLQEEQNGNNNDSATNRKRTSLQAEIEEEIEGDSGPNDHDGEIVKHQLDASDSARGKFVDLLHGDLSWLMDTGDDPVEATLFDQLEESTSEEQVEENDANVFLGVTLPDLQDCLREPTSVPIGSGDEEESTSEEQVEENDANVFLGVTLPDLQDCLREPTSVPIGSGDEGDEFWCLEGC